MVVSTPQLNLQRKSSAFTVQLLTCVHNVTTSGCAAAYFLEKGKKKILNFCSWLSTKKNADLELKSGPGLPEPIRKKNDTKREGERESRAERVRLDENTYSALKKKRIHTPRTFSHVATNFKKRFTAISSGKCKGKVMLCWVLNMFPPPQKSVYVLSAAK